MMGSFINLSGYFSDNFLISLERNSAHIRYSAEKGNKQIIVKSSTSPNSLSITKITEALWR